MTQATGIAGPRSALVERRTRETTVRVQLRVGPSDQDGRDLIQTGNGFLDHMLVTLARYAGWDLRVQATGDLKHHLVEDVAISIGTAVSDLMASPVARFGERTVVMDDALVQVALDLGGRPYYEGPLPSSLYDHWMRSFSDHARATLHVNVIRGRDRHHIVEAGFKALGFALKQAMVPGATVLSTKGEVAQ